MGLFDIFEKENESKIKFTEQELLKKLEFKDRVIKSLERNIESKNNEIEALKQELSKYQSPNNEPSNSSQEVTSTNQVEEKTDQETQNAIPATPKAIQEIPDTNEMRKRLLDRIKEETKTRSYFIDYELSNEDDIFMSKFGGLGYWDKSMQYPTDDNGNQLVLLAQINFDRDKFNDSRLPNHGILQFYILPDDTYGLDVRRSSKVIYHENVNYSLRKEELSNIKTNLTLDGNNGEFFPFEKEFKISFTEKEDYINPTNYNFKELVDRIVTEEFKIDLGNNGLFRFFGDKIMDYLYENLNTYGNKLLGYPYFTQTDPRESTGFNEYKVLLFQMDSDTDIMWGDSGVANFFIKDYNNLTDSLFTWDCM